MSAAKPLLLMFAALATQATQALAADLSADNPFAQPSALAFEYPPFDRIRDTDYGSAFEAGMAAQLAEVAAIANDPQAPPALTTPSSRWSAQASC
jgi:peptidyl-dipeptidase Dcp